MKRARTLTLSLLAVSALLLLPIAGCGGGGGDTNGGGTVTTPVITGQPSATSVTAGGSFTLSVTATGGSLSYRWLRDGTQVSSSRTYTVSSATAADAGSYIVTVSNTAGSVTSDAATVTVTTASTSGDANVVVN